MSHAHAIQNLTWTQVVQIAIAAALNGDRDTAEAMLEARNHRLDPIRGALAAAVEDILSRHDGNPIVDETIH